MQKKNQPTNKQTNQQANKQTKQNKRKQKRATENFCEHNLSKPFFQGCSIPPPTFLPPPPRRLLVVIKLCVDFAWLHNSYIHSSGDMLQTMIILFSTDWTMAGMKTLIIIFVIMFPVAMITQEDVNHGGNN